MIFPILNKFCIFTSAIPAVCSAQHGSLISSFPGVLLRYCLSDIETVPVAPIITGITCFYLQSTCAQFLLYSLKFYGLISSSLDHISASCYSNICLTCMSLVYYHGLRYLVYCYE